MRKDVDNMIYAAHRGGEVLRRYWGTELEVTQKTSASDVCTVADTESEKEIIDELTKQFPDYNIFSEESGTIDRKSKYTFVIDPLDGTANFVMGLPIFSVSIALLEWNSPIAAVVYSPVLKLTYSATKGGGAFLGNNRITVSEESDIQRSIISKSTGYAIHNDTILRMISLLYEKEVKRVTTHWSMALDLCLLASGKIEGIVNYKTEVYDFIAGKLIAKEAGAVIVDWDGKPEQDERNDRFIAANNQVIAGHLLDVARKVSI